MLNFIIIKHLIKKIATSPRTLLGSVIPLQLYMLKIMDNTERQNVEWWNKLSEKEQRYYYERCPLNRAGATDMSGIAGLKERMALDNQAFSNTPLIVPYDRGTMGQRTYKPLLPFFAPNFFSKKPPYNNPTLEKTISEPVEHKF